MNKKMRLAALLILILCLSGCGNNKAVSSDTDAVEEVMDEQSDEISDAVAPPESAEDESIEADNETVDADNENPELNEVESADETILEAPVTRTECNEIVYTNATSNIRIQPFSSAEKVETVNKGTELQRTAILDNGWSEIQYNETTCYISSKLVDTENAVTETAANTNSNESVPDDTYANKSAPVNTTTQSSNGETKTFSNGATFIQRGYTPNGLKIWYISDDDGTWPDFMVASYDATGITNNMSDYEKAVAINNYICRVVEYDYDFYYGIKTYRPASEIGRHCLTTGLGVCEDYAEAFDCLCTMAGVYSNVVHGTGTNTAGTGPHAWNYVLIGDTKYWIDTTWNDTTNNAYLMSTTPFADHVFKYEAQ